MKGQRKLYYMHVSIKLHTKSSDQNAETTLHTGGGGGCYGILLPARAKSLDLSGEDFIKKKRSLEKRNSTHLIFHNHTYYDQTWGRIWR